LKGDRRFCPPGPFHITDGGVIEGLGAGFNSIAIMTTLANQGPRIRAIYGKALPSLYESGGGTLSVHLSDS
jgi:hypothetical protein